MATGGFTPLDQEREASMADEGGAAGAQMEHQEAIFRPVSRGRWDVFAKAGLFALAGLGIGLLVGNRLSLTERGIE